METLTVDNLCDDSPWDIAERLGIRYMGDANTFDHDGLYYSTANWAKYGYADCVRIFSADGRRFSEAGTINRPDDLDDCLRSAGIERDADGLHANGEPIEQTPELEIECVFGHRGADASEDYSGRFAHNFPDDVKERRFWKHCINWIIGLVE